MGTVTLPILSVSSSFELLTPSITFATLVEDGGEQEKRICEERRERRRGRTHRGSELSFRLINENSDERQNFQLSLVSVKPLNDQKKERKR